MRLLAHPLIFGTADAQIKDLVLSYLLLPDLVKMANKGGGPPDAPTTMWSPSIVVTNRNCTRGRADNERAVSKAKEVGRKRSLYI